MKRRRYNPVFIITVIVIVAIMAYIDVRGRLFLEEFKKRSLILIKEKIGLDGGIGGIEGGIFRNVILKDVVLHGRKDSMCPDGPTFFSAKAIILNYRIWDIVCGKPHEPNKLTFVSPRVYFDNLGEMTPVPRAIDPKWKEVLIYIRDGEFYDKRPAAVISGLNGNFRLDEKGIESGNVTASVFGQRFTGGGTIGFPIANSKVLLNGVVRGKGYLLNAQLNGAVENVAVRGSLESFGGFLLSFTGNVTTSGDRVDFEDFSFGGRVKLDGWFRNDDKEFEVDLYSSDNADNAAALGEVSAVGIKGEFLKLPYFTVKIAARHLKLFGFDLLSNYNVNGRLNYDKDGVFTSITGDFNTSGSLIDYDPIGEFKGAYEFADNRIKLQGFNYGDVLFANGFISLAPPYEMDINVKFKGLQLAGLADITLEKGMISGLIFGEIRACGEPGNLKIEGQIDFMNGNIGMVKYNSARICLRGNAKTLEFFNSKVYTEDEVLTLEGRMDMKDIGTFKVFRNVVISSDPKRIVWAGASVMRIPGGEEIVSGRDINEQFRVNFKTYSSQQSEDAISRQDEMELEYRLGKPGNLKLRMKENDDFFGVEQKVKF